jgi:predicted RNA binding protein YcfA (HicA-like mRNA interferase family)
MNGKKMPCVTGVQIVLALQRDGWTMVCQKGHHVRIQKDTPAEILKLIVPAHRPIKRSTLAHILKQTGLSVDGLTRLL